MTQKHSNEVLIPSMRMEFTFQKTAQDGRGLNCSKHFQERTVH
jgi:hypothetical protein